MYEHGSSSEDDSDDSESDSDSEDDPPAEELKGVVTNPRGALPPVRETAGSMGSALGLGDIDFDPFAASPTAAAESAPNSFAQSPTAVSPPLQLN